MSASTPTRSLGHNGPQIPALGLGLMGLSSKPPTIDCLELGRLISWFSAFYGTKPPDEERFAFLDRAYELGCRHWDSASMYGDCEELLGRWFQRTGKRSEVKIPRQDLDAESRTLYSLSNQIFLTTKFGNFVTPEGGREIRNDPDFIRQSVVESLDKLQTDYVDLLYW